MSAKENFSPASKSSANFSALEAKPHPTNVTVKAKTTTIAKKLLNTFENPYEYSDTQLQLSKDLPAVNKCYKTYCGT